MRLSVPVAWDFDIDRWLGLPVPSPPWKWLPGLISHILGYRTKPQKPIGNLIITAWAFLGIFAGLTVIIVASKHVATFEERHGQIILGSFGAASVLNFYAIESPLAQPRNSIFGQVISSVVGVAVCNLFALSPHFESIRWLGGALACALANTLMAITKTVHPPGGATALLAVVNDDILLLGWWLIPAVLLKAVLLVLVALVINNVQRKYPQYWWIAENLTQHSHAEAVSEIATKIDVDSQLQGDPSKQSEGAVSQVQLTIKKGSVVTPDHMYLTPEERMFLVELSNRLF